VIQRPCQLSKTSRSVRSVPFAPLQRILLAPRTPTKIWERFERLARFAVLVLGSMTLSFSVATTAHAQTTNCSLLSGVVHDSTNAVIPGTSIQLDSLEPIFADSLGHFRLACVSPGGHILRVSFAGFSPLSVNIKAPHSIELSITLKPEVVQTDVNVSDAEDTPAAQNSATSTGPSQSLSGNRLQTLADDPDDLLRELQQMSAAAGGNPANAVLSIDGFQSGDNNTTVPPKFSIGYIKVNSDLFSSEYRNPPFHGGQIEVYTKPGQKAFHGALFATNSSAWMNARDPFSVSRASIGKQRYGFELTGPIHKDGSDFLLNLEHRSIDNFAAVNAIGIDAAGTQTPIQQNVPSPQRLWIGMAKVDWQLGPKNTFMASFGVWHKHQENVGAGGTTLSEAAYDSEAYDHNVHLTDITTISSKIMHEARLGIEFDGTDQTPNSSAPQLQVSGAFTSGGNTSGAKRDHEIDVEYNDDAILSFSKHLIKFGSQFEFLRERFRYFNNFNGTWTFGGGSAPVLDASHNPTTQVQTITGVEQYVRALNGWAGGAATQYSNAAGNPTINLTQYREALFFQDDWNILPNLHFAWGLRYYTQNKPMVHNNFNPRFGLAWSPGKSSTWTLHGHAGLYSGRFGAHNYAQVLDMDGRQRITSLVYTPSCPGSFDPNTCNAFSSATPVTSSRTVQPHMPNLFYGVENVGFSHTIAKHWSVSADYFITQMWHYTRTENINSPTDGEPLGPRPLVPHQNILQWQASGRGYGNVLYMGVSNQSLKRIQFSLGAVRANIVDNTNDDPNFSPQATGSNVGEYARRTGNPLWNVFGNTSAKLPRGLQLSANFNAQGEQVYNVTTGFDNNGDGNFNDRPFYVQSGTSLCSSAVTANCGYTTPWGLLSPSGSGATIPRNAGIMPWTVYLDANLQRTFQLTRDPNGVHPQALTVNARSSKALNHLNVTSVGGILGSPLFGRPYAGDNGRRLEFGLRYAF
jgi:hypothetical protein